MRAATCTGRSLSISQITPTAANWKSPAKCSRWLVKRRNNLNDNQRVTLRNSHVGTYLLGEGTALLERKVDFHPPVGQRLRSFLRAHPDECYLFGIAMLTVAIVLTVVVLLTAPATSLGLVLLSVLAVLLPSSQSAVQIMNYLVTQFLPPEILPKLDFSEGTSA